MVQNVFFRPVALAAAIVSFITSLLWSVLSLLSILFYNDIIKYNKKRIPFGNRHFMDELYNLYYLGNNDTRIINSDGLYIISWIYFVFSILWTFSCGVQIVLIAKNHKPRKLNVSTTVWLLLCYCVCTIDFITFVLLMVDYNKTNNFENDTPDNELKLLAIFTMALISAKGFVLWLVLFIFAIILSVLIKSLQIEIRGEDDIASLVDNSSSSNIYNSIIYNAYESTEDSTEPKPQQSWVSKMLSERFKFENVWFNKNKPYANKPVTSLPRINLRNMERTASESEEKYNSYRSARNTDISDGFYNEIYSPEETSSSPKPDYSPEFARRFENNTNNNNNNNNETQLSFLHAGSERF